MELALIGTGVVGEGDGKLVRTGEERACCCCSNNCC